MSDPDSAETFVLASIGLILFSPLLIALGFLVYPVVMTALYLVGLVSP